MLSVNDKLYYFSKNLLCAGGYLVNSKAHGKWHVSNLNGAFLLNEVRQNCDCGYLNGYIEEKEVECLHYLKLLFAAFNNNKAEILFKYKMFLSVQNISDIVSYLEEFTSKQIDFACKYNVVNTLPIIKRFGFIKMGILRNMNSILKKRRNGSCIYEALKGYFERLNFERCDLEKKLVDFLRKIHVFDAASYWDYIDMLAQEPGVTVKDFFHKHYLERHYEMSLNRKVFYTPSDIRRYGEIAEELSWINREENGYHIMVPRSIDELKAEGNAQHNCVYTNRYSDRVIDRQSIIVFLRKIENVSYITIEFDYETFEVMQAYQKYNKPIDDGIYEYIESLGKRLRCEMHSQQ